MTKHKKLLIAILVLSSVCDKFTLIDALVIMSGWDNPHSSYHWYSHTYNNCSCITLLMSSVLKYYLSSIDRTMMIMTRRAVTINDDDDDDDDYDGVDDDLILVVAV